MNNKKVKEKYIDVNKLFKDLKDIYTSEDIKKLRELYDAAKVLTNVEARQIREIVPIEEWLSSPYYLGSTAHTLYPYWREHIIKIVNSPTKINQVIFSGSLGSGKTTAATILLIRRIYELSCYENIATLFHLGAISRIAFAYISITKDQAQITGFSKIVDMIDDIPYFKEHFPRDGGLNSAIVFPSENMFVLAGSILNHFIGMDVIGSILDEANFFQGADRESQDMKMNNKAAQIYNQLQTRASSRFIVNGVNHSLSILISSSTTTSSFVEEQINNSIGDPHTYIVSPAIWDVKPHQFSGERFLFYTGGDGIDPFILDSISDLNMILQLNKLPEVGGIGLIDAYQELPWDIRSKIILVPIELMRDFRSDKYMAMQNLAGFSVSASNKFFSNANAYNKCIDDSIVHPFSQEQVFLSTTDVISQEGFMPLDAYWREEVVLKNKQLPHYIHLDLALTGDSAAISMAHISDWQIIRKGQTDFVDDSLLGQKEREEITTINLSKDGEQFIKDKYSYLDNVDSGIRLPIITVDMMLRINPPTKPNQIALSKIRDFIVYLRNVVGVNIKLITADQFQSSQLMQELQELGFNTGYLSVDRTENPYTALGNLLSDGRLKTYNYAPFRHELFNLIHYRAKKKIDHPHKGSKDVSDSVAGSVYNAVMDQQKDVGNTEELSDLFLDANLTDKQKYEQEVQNMMDNLLKGII